MTNSHESVDDGFEQHGDPDARPLEEFMTEAERRAWKERLKEWGYEDPSADEQITGDECDG